VVSARRREPGWIVALALAPALVLVQQARE
jgi:hypothetical protein